MTINQIGVYLEEKYDKRVTNRTILNWMRNTPPKNPKGKPLEYPKDQVIQVLAEKSYFDRKKLLVEMTKDIEHEHENPDYHTQADDIAEYHDNVLSRNVEKYKDDLLKKLILNSLGYSDFNTEKIKNDMSLAMLDVDELTPEEYQNVKLLNQQSFSRYLKK